MSGHELKVTRNSFWAKYDGEGTCEVKARYLMFIMVVLLVVGVVLMIFVDWQAVVSLLVMVGGLAAVWWLLDSIESKTSRLGRFVRHRYVKWPAIVLFAPIWIPIGLAVAVIGAVAFLLYGVVKWLGEKMRARREAAPMVATVMSQREVDTREKKKRQEVVKKTLDEHIGTVCAHVSLVSLFITLLVLYFITPGPRSVLAFPFMLALFFFILFVVFFLAVTLLPEVFAVPAYRLYQRLAGTRFGRFCGALWAIASDAYHRVCRKIVVYDYVVGGYGLIMREFPNKRGWEDIVAGVADIVLLPYRSYPDNEMHFRVYFRNEDAMRRFHEKIGIEVVMTQRYSDQPHIPDDISCFEFVAPLSELLDVLDSAG